MPKEKELSIETRTLIIEQSWNSREIKVKQHHHGLHQNELSEKWPLSNKTRSMKPRATIA